MISMKQWAGCIRRLTDLDVPAGIKKDIVRLDVAMDDVLAVEMGETFASLQECQQSSKQYCDDIQHTSLQMVEICASVI